MTKEQTSAQDGVGDGSGAEDSETSPKPIATLPPIPVLHNQHLISSRTGEPVRPATVVVAMVAFMLSAAGVAVAYGIHWWQAAHPETYPSSAWLIGWVEPEPGKWLSLTLEAALAAVVALVTGLCGVAGLQAWNGWRWTRWLGPVALVLAGAMTALLSWWGLIAVALALAGCAALFLPRTREFFRQFESHRGTGPTAYRRPEQIFYGRLPRYR